MFELPDPEQALTEPNGLLAIGGDLSPPTLIQAYQKGIFPWFGPGEPIMWWSPDPRLVLFFADFKISKSFQKTLAKQNFTVSSDLAFEQVIYHCAHLPSRENQTWITPEMMAAYVELHKLGIAHSIEVWNGKPKDSELIGGLYGVSLGKAFFGESMFSLKPDASKIALYFLIQFLSKKDLSWIDCQVPTGHLISLGAKAMPRTQFLMLLKQAFDLPSHGLSWTPALLS